MATKKGVWNLQQVRDKQLQDLWSYAATVGTWFTFGLNNYGNLAQNNRTNYSSPVQVPGTTWANGATGLSGEAATHGIKTDGTLWAWGYGGSGWTGLNNTTNYSSPVQVPGTTWARVAAGTDQVVANKTDGTLWTWGQNGYGQLCTGNDTPYSSPKQIPGTSWATGRKSISSTGRSVLALRTDGTLWSWGGNYAGRGGTNQAPGGSNQYFTSPRQIPGSSWSLVEAGPHTGFAIRTDGTLWGWGGNWDGRLGQNSIGAGGGNNFHGYSSPVQIPGTTWKDVAFSHENEGGAIAIKTDGTMWAWGDGSNGQLGVNDNVQYSSPVQIPGTTWDMVDGVGMGGATAIKTDGTAWVWGKGLYGGLGQNDLIYRSSPTQVPGSWNVTVRGGSKDYSIRTLLGPV